MTFTTIIGQLVLVLAACNESIFASSWFVRMVMKPFEIVMD
jgi:hypothetical protein